MPERLAGVAPFPAYLDEVEALVGLPMYADEHAEAVARRDPAAVDREGLQLRHELYLMVQFAITGASTPAELTDQALVDGWRAVRGFIPELRRQHQSLIGHVRGELMEADEGNKTPAVRRLEAALKDLPPSPQRARPHRRPASQQPNVLPAYATTLRSVGRIVTMARSDALAALRQRHIELPRVWLPGANSREYVVPWTLVDRLGQEFGYLEGKQLRLSELPNGPDDTDEEKIANARRLQRELVPPSRLVNIFGVVSDEELAAMHMTARPYQITLSAMERLLGGGYHFMENYIAKRGIQSVCKLHPRARFIAEFISKEVAADARDAYMSIPFATAAHVPLFRIAEQAGVARNSVRSSLRTNEQAALTRLRAQRPVGRVADHLPEPIAAGVRERLTRKALPTYRIPVANLPAYLNVGYSAVMHQIAKMPVYVPELFIVGYAHKMSCCDWSVVHCLEMLVGRREGVERIEYDQLPRGADDMRSGYAQYAREVQARLSPANTRGKWNTLITTESYPDMSELAPQVQREIRDMALGAHFTERATIRLLVERGHILRPGCSERGLSELMKLRPPPTARSLDKLARELDINPHSAIKFLYRYRGQIFLGLDADGYSDIFLGKLSAEMLLRWRFPTGEPGSEATVEVAPSTWKHIGQILPLVNATSSDFYHWIKLRGEGEGDVAQWMRSGEEGPVLPHYPPEVFMPFVRNHPRSNRGGPPKSHQPDNK